jgi:DNA invertase Pin-like site-specific DNA recombinase
MDIEPAKPVVNGRMWPPGQSGNKQTVENQLRELRQIAERRGWHVVEEYHDAGISGAKGRKDRPGLDRMLQDAQRRRLTALAAL